MNARDEVGLTAVLLEEVAKPANEDTAKAHRRYTIRDLRAKLLGAAARSQRVPNADLMLRLAAKAENAIVRQLGDGETLPRWLLEAAPAEVTALLRKAAKALRGDVSK